MNEMNLSRPPAIEKRVLIPVEAYVSEDYARAESDRLWPKVWQIACREEDLKNVGDFVTYDILDESIIIVRSAPDRLQAFYNVCPHRGRRLTKGQGCTSEFYCNFHGWRWNVDGTNAFVLDREDWGETLCDDVLNLKPVRFDTWGGWVWVTMDPDGESLQEYLGAAHELLSGFKFEEMRYRWRQWLYFPCNWKTALEAFIESYHVDASHPQLVEHGSNRWWCRTDGRISWHGVAEPRGTGEQAGMGMLSVRAEADEDPRIIIAEQLTELWETVGTTTRTFVDCANRLKDELPPGTPADQVAGHLMMQAARIDAERGAPFPNVTPEHFAACGLDWHIFPNSLILPGVQYALCYRARPNGYDPDSCIFEVYILERFPPGEEPETEWVFEPDPTEEKWRLILSQDFSNMPEVQKGMKSRAFAGTRPGPIQEVPVINFHRTLAQYMGTGAPVELE